ncbi:hypothetical protein CTM62_05370 [Prevotella intermedia]|uniref:Uncharacterized protein n=1 Tax=Prevotella intermedia TaxID=28131 RepID=A0A2D3L6K7_PREIN|nr:hypothetical protein CTM62_05370 [Prevotella intermedia]
MFSSAHSYAELTLFSERKEYNRGVNIFHKHNYRVTVLLSTYCKTYCFAFQKRLFCTVKA